mmetsp:Transcript_85636/g.105116  ORF Transcript_85636/g.105116 Transcript_85636/m.105116 type:complete len:219 (+) Transcript_85636:42-698(+)
MALKQVLRTFNQNNKRLNSIHKCGFSTNFKEINGIITEIDIFDTILDDYKSVINDQYNPYKNHCYRVINYFNLFWPINTTNNNIILEKVALSAVFHDIGLWTENTVDYIDPSVHEAQEYLKNNNKTDMIKDVSSMIDLHHKIRSIDMSEYPNNGELIETFRKSDWIDVTQGMLRFGLNKNDIKNIQITFPNLGFHDNLNRLAKQAVMNRQNPIPMYKW